MHHLYCLFGPSDVAAAAASFIHSFIHEILSGSSFGQTLECRYSKKTFLIKLDLAFLNYCCVSLAKYYFLP